MTFQNPTDRELRRRIAKDLKRLGRVSGAARTDNPSQCNCCMIYTGKGAFWRGVKVFCARRGRWWAMGPNIPAAERLVIDARKSTPW